MKHIRSLVLLGVVAVLFPGGFTPTIFAQGMVSSKSFLEKRFSSGKVSVPCRFDRITGRLLCPATVGSTLGIFHPQRGHDAKLFAAQELTAFSRGIANPAGAKAAFLNNFYSGSAGMQVDGRDTDESLQFYPPPQLESAPETASETAAAERASATLFAVPGRYVQPRVVGEPSKGGDTVREDLHFAQSLPFGEAADDGRALATAQEPSETPRASQDDPVVPPPAPEATQVSAPPPGSVFQRIGIGVQGALLGGSGEPGIGWGRGGSIFVDLPWRLAVKVTGASLGLNLKVRDTTSIPNPMDPSGSLALNTITYVHDSYHPQVTVLFRQALGKHFTLYAGGDVLGNIHSPKYVNTAVLDPSGNVIQTFSQPTGQDTRHYAGALLGEIHYAPLGSNKAFRPDFYGGFGYAPTGFSYVEAGVGITLKGRRK